MDGNFLKSQIITYMGNKRKLLGQIGDLVDIVRSELSRDITSADAFSGSGIVSRLLKTKSSHLFVNDLAGYSLTLNKCYLSTPSARERSNIAKFVVSANEFAHRKDLLGKGCKKGDVTPLVKRWIGEHWSPSGEIMKEDRAYFTEKNGLLIDRYRHFIKSVPKKYRHFLLAPLLVKCSIHNNTNGMFAAFYKDENGIGKYGGRKGIDLKRITGDIVLEMPIFSPNPCKICVSKMDVQEWVDKIPPVDLIYLDPPYNKHPYSIYYFMLDIINDWDTGVKIPPTNRGQPRNWTRSAYNSLTHADKAFSDLIQSINAKFIILSYNNKGIIPIARIVEVLSTKGMVYTFPVKHKTYNKLKGLASYKRKGDWSEVKEFLWLVDTRTSERII